MVVSQTNGSNLKSNPRKLHYFAGPTNTGQQPINISKRQYLHSAEYYKVVK